MDLVAAPLKEERGAQHVHGWENVILEDEEIIATAKLTTVQSYFNLLS